MKYFEVRFRIEAPGELQQTARELLSALAGEAGFETFEDTTEGLTGYVQQPLFDRDALDALVATFPLEPCTIAYDVREAEYRDWNEEWENAGFDPIVVGPYVIHDGRHHSVGADPVSFRHPDGCGQSCPEIGIEIHARQAFGTGTHETTRMMVALLAGGTAGLSQSQGIRLQSSDGQTPGQPLRGLRVLDCGTGTGILAIAALKGGAAEAVGYDIDEWSTDNARHNAELNGVADRFSVLLGDVAVLEEVEGLFDIVMANINRNILLADMPAMAAKLKPGGRLLLSGFLSADTGAILSRAKELGLQLVAQRQEGGWEAVAEQLTITDLQQTATDLHQTATGLEQTTTNL